MTSPPSRIGRTTSLPSASSEPKAISVTLAAPRHRVRPEGESIARTGHAHHVTVTTPNRSRSKVVEVQHAHGLQCGQRRRTLHGDAIVVESSAEIYPQRIASASGTSSFSKAPNSSNVTASSTSSRRCRPRSSFRVGSEPHGLGRANSGKGHGVERPTCGTLRHVADDHTVARRIIQHRQRRVARRLFNRLGGQFHRRESILCPSSSASSEAMATSGHAEPGATIFGATAVTRPSMFVTVPRRSCCTAAGSTTSA